MSEKAINEVNKAAQILGLAQEEVQTKWNKIVEDNDLDLQKDDEVNLGLTLFRQWFTGVRRVQESGQTVNVGGGGSLVKTGFGVIVAVEEARDFEEYARNQLQAEFMRDRNATYNAGKFAYAEQMENGNYKISQIFENELKERTENSKGQSYTELPPSSMEIDNQLIIPIDERKVMPWGDENKSYGHPKPKNNWRRTVHFIGEVNNGGIQYWRIMTKDNVAENWNLDAEEFVHLNLIWDADKGEAYPVKDSLETAVYNKDMENAVDTSTVNLSNLVAENMRDKVTGLINLENYHGEVSSLPQKARIVVTDGNITNMNMNPSEKTGNRTLRISDINADFDYDNDGESSTACWVPSHVNIDFGLGSHVLVIGRTSQSTNQETGQLRPVSINVCGLIVLSKRGNPSSATDSGETDTGWF
tara:strand:- start:4796 stop:6043 length:1248 start_codon:yes stop_codon:yes gene_type:complete